METKMANNSAEASRENFWSILNNKKYTISIPRIQRDYAQGRKEPEPTQIRQTFLKDAFNSLTNNVPMDINFIYGNLDKNEDGIEKFIPIDGQQRLTTLFLIFNIFNHLFFKRFVISYRSCLSPSVILSVSSFIYSLSAYFFSIALR